MRTSLDNVDAEKLNTPNDIPDRGRVREESKNMLETGLSPCPLVVADRPYYTIAQTQKPSI